MVAEFIKENSLLTPFPTYAVNPQVPLFQETCIPIGVSRDHDFVESHGQRRLYWSLSEARPIYVCHDPDYRFKPQWYSGAINTVIRNFEHTYEIKGKYYSSSFYAPVAFKTSSPEITWETDGYNLLRYLRAGMYAEELERFKAMDKEDGRYYLLYCGEHWENRVYIAHESQKEYLDLYPVIGQVTLPTTSFYATVE